MHAQYLTDLDHCISMLEAVKKQRKQASAQKYFRDARMAFKRMEPLLSFTDIHNYRTLNMPNLLKIEEEDATDIKIKEPVGLQVMEEIIFALSPDWKTMDKQADYIETYSHQHRFEAAESASYAMGCTASVGPRGFGWVVRF
jgi:cytochrome c peroxidase